MSDLTCFLRAFLFALLRRLRSVLFRDVSVVAVSWGDVWPVLLLLPSSSLRVRAGEGSGIRLDVDSDVEMLPVPDRLF